MKQEQQTFLNLRLTTADGQTSVAEYKSEKQAKEIKAEAAKIGSTVEEIKAQTFTVTQAETWDEASVLVPNDEVRLGYFNYGLTLEQHNVKRALMKDDDWSPVEGSYDLLADVQSVKEGRKQADPLSASKRAIRALWKQFHGDAEPPTDEEIVQALSALVGVTQAPAETTA